MSDSVEQPKADHDAIARLALDAALWEAKAREMNPLLVYQAMFDHLYHDMVSIHGPNRVRAGLEYWLATHPPVTEDGAGHSVN